MSLLGVYAYAWAIESVRYCLICCSFALRDSSILLHAHAEITNIVPTAGPTHVKVSQGVRTPYRREILGFSGRWWHGGASPGATHSYRSDNIERIYRCRHPPAGQQGHLVFAYFS